MADRGTRRRDRAHDMTPRVHPIADEALGNTAYLVNVGDGLALAVDPRRDTDEYLELAQRSGLQIVGVLETHLHADFVSGARELAEATGAEVYAAADASLQHAHTPLRPGARITIGDATVEVIATPGHTPEHVAYLVTVDGTRMLFSGGSLIVGGVARTDLSGADRTEELAHAQFHSLRALDALGDDTLLYPTHGAGSFCSTGPARSVMSTLGAERAPGSLFAIGDEDLFVKTLLAGYGSYPRYFAHLRTVNQAGATLLSALPPVAALAADAARTAVAGGAWLIDGRATDDWARAHPVGAISIAVRPDFASWLGWCVPFGEAVVLVVDPEQVAEATRLARRIGYDRILGWLTFDAWRDADLPVASIDTLTPAEAAERAARGALLLDVRQDAEVAVDRIPGATHIELGDIIAGARPPGDDVITYCAHGPRGSTAASLLERDGIRVADLRGGLHAWRRAGLPIDAA